MKNKIIISLLSLVIVMSLVMSACTKDTETAATTTTAAVSQAADETEAKPATVESSDISFYEAKDDKGNVLTLSPIYAKDGKKVVAAYIVSVKDSAGKILDSKAYPLIGSVVSATSNEKSIALTTDAKKNYIKIESYADEKGNLVAIQDVSDINGNGNKTEYIKLSKTTNEKGSVHYLLTDSTIEIKKEKDATYAVENGKKTKVTIVDSKNKTVNNKIKKDTASNEEKKNTDNNESGEKQNENSGGNSSENGGSSGGNSQNSASDEKQYDNIVLQKNGKAESSSKGVAIASNEVTINKAGAYRITSTTDDWHGIIKVMLPNTEEAELRFEDVHISYNKGSVIQIIDTSDNTDRSFLEVEADAGTVADDAIEELSDRDSAPNVDITFPTGTSSTFKSPSNVYTGVLYNEAKLTIKGNGSALFEAQTNRNNAISSSKSITIKNVSLTLKTAAAGVASSTGGCKGIHSYSKVTIESGSLKIDSNGDAIRCNKFYQEGGKLTAVSSACDGVDADDVIIISGGTADITALKKSCFKARRVNNQDRYDKAVAAGERVSAAFKKQCMREGKEDTFKINGGTVKGESYKVSTPRKSSSQKVIICKASKETKGNDDESKKPVKWNVSGVASSSNECIKFFYSSSSVRNNEYTVKANGSQKDTTWTWDGNIGVAKVISSTTV